MNRIINTVGIVVLLGILLKLSYVFVFLFSLLDNGSIISKATGVTFAFSSIWFVVKVEQRWLKLLVIFLDVCTILYFYLHSRLEIPVEYAAIIVASYSGLIVFYVGQIVSEHLQNNNDTKTKHLQTELNRLRTETEISNLEKEIAKTRRRIADSRQITTKQRHENLLNELVTKYEQLKKEII